MDNQVGPAPSLMSVPLIAVKIMVNYFSEQLKCRFVLADSLLHPHEVFDDAGAMCMFAPLADRRCQALFGKPLLDRVVPDNDALLGLKVHWVAGLSSLQMAVLVQSAEEVLGVDCTEEGEQLIDLLPAINYLVLSPEERKRVKCPWKPLKVL